MFVIRGSFRPLSFSIVLFMYLAPGSGFAAQQVQSNEGATRTKVEMTVDTLGRRVERRTASDYVEDMTFDRGGKLIRAERTYSDGRVVREHRLRDADGDVVAFASGLSDEEFELYARRLGLSQRTLPSVREEWSDESWARTYAWGSVVEGFDGEVEWRLTDVLGRRMEVTRLEERVDERVVLHSWDDWGGVRTDVLEDLPYYHNNHGIKNGPGLTHSRDAQGRIARVIVDEVGDPLEVLFGDNLIVRYRVTNGVRLTELARNEMFTNVWMELVDARTGEIFLDSRRVPSSSPPMFRFHQGGGHVQSWLDGSLFAAVRAPGGDVYALFPVSEGEVWRRVQVGGTDFSLFGTQVDYSATKMRVRFFVPNLAVEVPRHRQSGEAFKVLFPSDEVLASCEGRDQEEDC